MCRCEAASNVSSQSSNILIFHPVPTTSSHQPLRQSDSQRRHVSGSSGTSTKSDPDWNIISIFNSGPIRLSQHTFRTSEASSVLMMLGKCTSPPPLIGTSLGPHHSVDQLVLKVHLCGGVLFLLLRPSNFCSSCQILPSRLWDRSLSMFFAPYLLIHLPRPNVLHLCLISPPPPVYGPRTPPPPPLPVFPVSSVLELSGSPHCCAPTPVSVTETCRFQPSHLHLTSRKCKYYILQITSELR